MSESFPELSLKLSAHRWQAVLDPLLALSPAGLALVRHAGALADLWLPRELWHILDSSEYYAQRPQALDADEAHAVTLVRCIRAWEALRRAEDLAGARVFWLGDGPDESSLPDKAQARLLPGYEQLAGALAQRLGACRPLETAARDAVALAAALGGACVLSLLPPSGEPPLCRALQRWDVACSPVADGDAYAALERERVGRLLAHAGLAAAVWAGWRPAVVRLHLADPWPVLQPVGAEDDCAGEDDAPGPAGVDPWQGAQAFWFAL